MDPRIPHKLRAFALASTMALSSTLAFAHAVPKVMLPTADSVGPSPKQISVVFSETVEPKFSSLVVKDASGATVSKAASVADPKNARHLTLDVPPLAPGVYMVHWISVADDGHKAAGDYKFTVK